MKKTFALASLLLSIAIAPRVHAIGVMEVNEVSFNAAKNYSNPYMDVDLWVTLSGPNGESYFVPAFWDGGAVFRVRLVATSAGQWTWSTGTKTNDSGLDGQSGAFVATKATEAQKQANPNRRGFIRVNGTTLEYADGTPFFFTADTVWTAFTKIFPWNSAGIAGISFQDYFLERKKQGFNGVNVLASYPTDTTSSAEKVWAKQVQKQKISEGGLAPFKIVSDQADYTRINPQYWQETDQKMQFLSDHGFITFFESVRRHEEWPRMNATQKKAFTNYTRYLWARYGCYNMIYSWLHWDTVDAVYPDWLPLVENAHAYLKSMNGTGQMPYGQPRSAMAYGSSLETWAKDEPALLDVHNVSNKYRDERMYLWLRDMYWASPQLPAMNVEPYYPAVPVGEVAGLDATQMAQFQMYGSVLNGGFAGHAWGDAYFGGIAFWIDNKYPIPTNERQQKHSLTKWKSYAMKHLKDFMLDKEHDYRILKPASDTHLGNSHGDMHALAVSSDDESFALGLSTKGFPPTFVKGLKPDSDYIFEWWHVENGGWQGTTTLKSDSKGVLNWPNVPDKSRNWGYRVRHVDYAPTQPGPTSLANASTYAADSGWDASGEYAVGRAHDGNLATKAHSASLAAGTEAWIEYDLQDSYTLTHASILEDNAGNHEIASWKVQYFDGAWNDAFEMTPSGSSTLQEVDFPDVPNVTKIRLVVTTPASSDPKAEVIEFKCFGIPSSSPDGGSPDAGSGGGGSNSDAGPGAGGSGTDAAASSNSQNTDGGCQTTRGSSNVVLFSGLSLLAVAGLRRRRTQRQAPIRQNTRAPSATAR